VKFIYNTALEKAEIFRLFQGIAGVTAEGVTRYPIDHDAGNAGLFMIQDSKKFERLRHDMVSRQIEARGITDLQVLEAMRKVPRHFFVSEALVDQAYGDYPLPIGEQQTISQPYIVAEMTQALALGKDDRVLEIGTGSGYQTAILAEIVHRVYSIERLYPLYKKARVLFDLLQYHNIIARYSDGTAGWPDASPFDAIIVTAGSPRIPQPLLQQLGKGGRMVIPVGDSFSQQLIKIVRDDSGFHQTDLGGCRFVRLVGEHGWKES
jgi:protein-L-isoaspartate(D-aspartate) O-methyltransferase